MLSALPTINGNPQLKPSYLEDEMKAIVEPETLKIAAKSLEIDFKNDKNALADLKKKIRVNSLRGTDLINITAQGTDKKEAIRIATAVSNAYIKRRSDSAQAAAKGTLAALDNELIKQSEVVKKHREALTVLIQKYGIPYFDEDAPNQKAAPKNERFDNAQQQLSELKAQRDQINVEIKEFLETKDEELVKYVAGLDLPENPVKPYLAQYEAAIQQKQKLIAKGLAKEHPDMIAVNKKAKDAMKNAQSEIASLKAVLNTQLKLIEYQMKRMEKLLTDRKDDDVDLALKQHSYNEAKETYEQSRIMLREMKIKQQEARVLLKMPRAPITLHQKAK